MKPEPTPQAPSSGLRGYIDRLTESLFRSTSPDLPAAQRRLWVLTLATGEKCLLSPETGAHQPRWGAAAQVLFLADADTNNDGRIDFRDQYLVKVIGLAGEKAHVIGAGRSAAWSPDGRFVAILSDRGIEVVGLDGKLAAPDATSGKLVLTDSRLPDLAKAVWLTDVRSRIAEPPDTTLARKYQWLGSLAPDMITVAFPNAQRTDIFVARGDRPQEAKNVTQDAHVDLDPSWSPDQTKIVYVSANPSNQSRCFH